jgi:hypothetical protein
MIVRSLGLIIGKENQDILQKAGKKEIGQRLEIRD